MAKKNTKSEWQVSWRGIGELIPYEKNPRINEYTVPYLVNSIKRFGFRVPIVVDRDSVIICGHTRLLAAKQMGLEKVPCVLADDLTPAEVRAFRLADNKVQEISRWDYEKLQMELGELKVTELEMSELGFASFDNAEIEGLLPPELAGRDLEADDLDTSSMEQASTGQNRVVVTYKASEKGILEDVLGCKIPTDKVLMNAADILGDQE